MQETLHEERETFEKLKEIYPGELNGEEITHIDGKDEKADITVEKNKTTAHIIGIIPGDEYLNNPPEKVEAKLPLTG